MPANTAVPPMKIRKSETTTGIAQLNRSIAHFYQKGMTGCPLQASVDLLSEWVSGELHLAFLSDRSGKVTFATSGGNQGRDFLMSTMASARSHPLIYRTHGRVRAISDVLSPGEWSHREMCQAARPFLRMADSMGTDIEIAPGLILSTCAIRDERSFQMSERRRFSLLIPHLTGLFSIVSSGRECFQIIHLDELPKSRLAIARHVENKIGISMQCMPDHWMENLITWIVKQKSNLSTSAHGSEPHVIAARSTDFDCRAMMVPEGRHQPGAVILQITHIRRVNDASWELLTDRESEVADWLCEGKTNQEIAIILGIQPGTVKRHLENMYAKINAPNRSSAIRALLEAKNTSIG